MVAARLDSLPPEQRDLARRLAVFKYDFDLEEVALVADATRSRPRGADRRGDHRARRDVCGDVARLAVPA